MPMLSRVGLSAGYEHPKLQPIHLSTVHMTSKEELCIQNISNPYMYIKSHEDLVNFLSIMSS